jgi:hypothetical protein
MQSRLGITIPPEFKSKKRHMSRNQEIWNAMTILLPAGFVVYYLFSGSFVEEGDILRAKGSLEADSSFEDTMNQSGDGHRCISSPYFPALHALPPMTTISVALGYILHSPCSILYHFLCAFKLETGQKRMDHWSRRLDQSMIHIMGCFVNFGISGSVKYSLMTLAFSIDSIVRLFQPGFRPKGNQIRMLISLLFGVMPAFMYGYYVDVIKMVLIYGIAGWMFAAYPLGGYSHCIFHVVMALVTPLQLGMSTRHMISQEAIDIAAKCAVLAQGYSTL